MKTAFLDTPEKWVSLGAICIIGFLLQGISRVFSLLYVANMARYGVSRKLASMPFVVFTAVMNIIGPLAGYLNSRIGVRVVIILGGLFVSIGLSTCFFFENFTYVILFTGIGYGIGFGFSVHTIPHVLSYRFSDHIDKANSMFSAFSTIGSLTLVALTDFLLEKYGASGTYLILGAVTLHSVPATLLLWKPKPKNHKTTKITNCSANVYVVSKDNFSFIKEESYIQNAVTDEGTIQFNSKADHEMRDVVLHDPIAPPKPPSSSLFKVLLDPGFIIICVAQSVTIFVFVGYLSTLVDASIDKGVSKENGYQILLGMSIIDVFGRFFAGFVTDGGYLTRSNFIALSSLVMGISLILYIWFNGYILMMVIMCISGLCQGIIISISVGVVSIMVDKQDLRMATASRCFLFAPLSLCEPYVIGYFRDTLRSYDGLYLTLGVVIIAIGCLYLSFPKLRKLRDNCREIKNDNDQKT